MNTVYNIQEVAKILKTTQKAVRRLVASGDLESSKSGTKYIITSEALDEYKEKNESAPNDSIQLNLFGEPDTKKTEAYRPKAPNLADISAWWKDTPKSKMTFVDLFCGAGGLSKGLEMSGLEGVCGLDWFKEACMTYNRNFDHPFVNGDIKSPEIKEQFYETVKKQLSGRHLDIVAGGFPCQGFSMAGNRIVDDPRNSLYLELIEIVKRLQPDFVICENVKGLRSMLNGLVEKKIIDDFHSIGYEMNVMTLCAADYYTPQKRERVIFIGNRKGLKNYHPKPILQSSQYITTGTAIADLMEMPENKEFNHVPTKHRPDMAQRMLELPEGQSLYKGYSDAWKKCP